MDFSDSGYYICTASNKVEQNVKTFVRVEVESQQTTDNTDKTSKEEEEKKDEKPKSPLVFIKSRSVLNVSPGVELTLSCYVSKNANPNSITFTNVNGSPMSDRVTLNRLPFKGDDDDFHRLDLTFTPFTEVDAGQYKCLASNENGDNYDLASIEKQEDDSFVFFTSIYSTK